MRISPRFFALSLCVLLTGSVVSAQENLRSQIVASAAPTITVAATGERVRFIAPSNVVRIRVEVFNESGTSLFDINSKGNVFDWTLLDGNGQRVVDGSFLCVVTVKSLSGKISQRAGTVSVQGGVVTLRPEGAQLTPAQQQAVGPFEENAVLTVLPESDTTTATVVAHDGREGQVTSTTGALTFRTGDVFAGKDKEQMRISEDGRVGIGTDKPESTLDVAGALRVSEGVKFSDGTTLDAAGGKLLMRDASGELLAPLTTGTGTQNRVAKWLETGGSGTLGDSAITEIGGNVGVGTVTPATPLDINGAATFGPTGQGRLRIDADSPGNNLTLNVSGANGYMYMNPSSGFTIFKAPANTLAQLQVEGAGNPPFSLSGAVRTWNGTSNANAPMLFYTAGVNLSTSQLQAGDIKFYPGLSYDLTTRIGNHSVFFSPSGSGSTIFENGNVGIGTSNPLAKLDVVGDAKVTSNLTVDTNTLFVNAASDRVGIGTTTPAAKLQVVGTVNFTGLRTEVIGAYPNVIGGASNNTVTPGVNGATIGGGGQEHSLPNSVTDDFGTVSGGERNTAGDNAGTTLDRMYATVSGGIGNTASGTLSTVPGGANNTAQGDYSLAAGQRAQALHQGSFVWSDSTTSFPNSFSSTAANQFLINATGGVGIGTNAPAARLHVRGASNDLNVPIALVESTGNQVGLSFRSGTDGHARIRSDINGNLVFATLTGMDKDIHFRAGDDVNTDMLIDGASGNVTISGALTVTSCTGCSPPSDRNLKANFSPANPRFILNRLASIPIQTWNYKNEPTAVRHIGPMAQDFSAAFGYGTNDKSLNTVDANGVTMAAIQGLYQQNQELKGVVTQLRARLTQLERRMPQRRTVRTHAHR